MSKQKSEENNLEELFCQCGMFCGFCTSYLSKKYQIPRRRGIISYCVGCRPRNKQCSFIKKKCTYSKKDKIVYCYECPDFPCNLIEKINASYISNSSYSYSFIENLEIIKNEGYLKVISNLKKAHSCKKCGEILCIHNGLCYNCDTDIITTMKNYRNDKK